MDETSRPTVAALAAQAKEREQAGDAQGAVRSYLAATLLQMLQLTPQDLAACFQLGLTFSQDGNDHRAQAAFRAALVLQPSHAEAWNNLGVLTDGMAALRRAIRLSPERADYHTNLAHALLSHGQLDEGFAEWEWRTPSPQRDFTQPRWDGSPFPGKTLLIHAEQGFGDCIQFGRYLPAAAKLGGTVLVEMRPPLAGPIGRLDGVAGIIPWGTPLPPFDLHLPLPSLAKFFHAAPTAIPYLSAPPGRRVEIPAMAAKKVGLVWACNPQAPDQRRSVPFEAIARLVRSCPNIAFHSLQREGEQACEGLALLGGRIGDFDDLAAELSSLDLLISVDTAAAHLAGAMGTKLWVLLPYAADWRWRPEWYPRARRYRQDRPGDWNSVLERVAEDLRRP